MAVTVVDGWCPNYYMYLVVKTPEIVHWFFLIAMKIEDVDHNRADASYRRRRNKGQGFYSGFKSRYLGASRTLTAYALNM